MPAVIKSVVWWLRDAHNNFGSCRTGSPKVEVITELLFNRPAAIYIGIGLT